MKLPEPIRGVLDTVGEVRPAKTGFSQHVIIYQEAVKNNQGYTLSKEQYFVVQIYSNKKDDSRFLEKEFKGAECAAEVYLDAHRYLLNNHYEYNVRFNLHKWVSEEPKPEAK